MTPARARTRRRLAGLALSLCVHAAILLAFMSVAPRLVTLPRLPPPPSPTFQLELRLARDLSSSAASPSRPAPRRAAERMPFATTAPSAEPSISEPRTPSPSSSAAQASPAAAAAAGQGATGGSGDRWRVRGEGGEGGDADAAARALVRGTIGCADAGWLHLTADERDHCSAEFLRGMRTLRPDAIPAAKRAYYDQVVAKIEEARGLSAVGQHASRPPMLRSSSPGLDVTMGARCAFRFGPGAARANRDDPCRLRLPLSPLTAETRVPPPASLSDRRADASAATKLDAPAAPPSSKGPGA